MDVVFKAQESQDLRVSSFAHEGRNLPYLLGISPAQLVHQHFEAQRLQCLKDIQFMLHELFRPFIEGRESRVVLMDVAIHANLGDNILWKAAANIITHFGISPKILCYAVQPSWVKSIDSMFPKCNVEEVIKTASDGGVVLLHAGGNWGDLYR